MAIPFLANVDLGNSQILNVLAQQLASDPTNAESRFYYNTTSHVLKYHNGTTWVSLVAAPTDAATLNGQLPTYYLARANHTGTQLSATISDLATVVQAYRLDQFAAPNVDLSVNSHKVTNLATPTASTDAATKAYVDTTAQGYSVRASVRVASTANVTVSSAPAAIDGVTLAANDRVLLKSQTAPAENGLYVFNGAASALTRSTDANTAALLPEGAFVFVEEGTANAATSWVMTQHSAITLGTTAITWAQVGAATAYAAGTGIALSGTTFSQDTANGYGVRKYVTSIGDGSATSYTVTHNLATRDVQVQAIQVATPYNVVFADVSATTTNTVTVAFTTAPTSNQYRVVVTG